jgi:DNA-binding response OmpR family regulator
MARLEKISVLVVNGNERMTQILRTALKAYGMGRVDEAFSLDEARVLYQSNPYDIVMTDVHLGFEAGFDLVRWLRGDDGTGPGPFTPVIVASASTEIKTVMTCVQSGADDFVTLPLSPATLFKHIERLIFKPHRYVSVPGYFGPSRRRRIDNGYMGLERRRRPPLDLRS